MFGPRRGNAPLRQALNVLSNGGVPIHMHGASAGGDPRLREGKLKVSTWHASKGTEAARCVELLCADGDALAAGAAIALVEQGCVPILLAVARAPPPKST